MVNVVTNMILKKMAILSFLFFLVANLLQFWGGGVWGLSTKGFLNLKQSKLLKLNFFST